MKDLPENIDSKYRFITIAALRCQMLQKGAMPKIEYEHMSKFTTIAMEEVLEGLIDFEIIAIKTDEEKEKELKESEKES